MTLTPTERLFMEEFVKEGATNAELAAVLNVTEQTVKFHFSNLLKKSDTRNRAALALWYLRTGRYLETRAHGVLVGRLDGNSD